MGVRSSTVAGIAVLAASLGLAACGGSHGQMESEARAAFQYAAAPWYCVNLPPPKAPLTLRCHQGQQFFTVEKVKAE